VAGIVAGNVFHRAVVLGAAAAPAWPVGRATLTIDGHVHDADEAPRHPVAVVRDVARVLEACGEQLAGHDRILAGSLVHVPVRAGSRVTARIDGLGEASAVLT
jgi:2-keto-4-pentenoate hydratase